MGDPDGPTRAENDDSDTCGPAAPGSEGETRTRRGPRTSGSVAIEKGTA